jgi:hypothetical protein
MKSVIDRMGYRPANIYELISFGEAYPCVQYQFDIFALGSVWENKVPSIDGHHRKRDCDLAPIGEFCTQWNSFCRLAIVRKGISII